MNTRLDNTYLPLNHEISRSQNSEKNIKISIDDIPKLMPEENNETIKHIVLDGVGGRQPVPDHDSREKKLTVSKSTNLGTRRDIKKNYSFF